MPPVAWLVHHVSVISSRHIRKHLNFIKAPVSDSHLQHNVNILPRDQRRQYESVSGWCASSIIEQISNEVKGMARKVG